MINVRRADERGHSDIGWLQSHHTFSFADYYDPLWMGFRSLRVINDDRVLHNRGFDTHPHRDMEIVTFVLSGQLQHRDSMGNGRIIRTDEVQYMSAGSGVQHSEFNPSQDEPVHFLQIWILPERRGGEPRYADRSFAVQPTGASRLHLVASRDGRGSSFEIRQDAEIWLAKLDTGVRSAHNVAAGRHAWIHVADGTATLNGVPLHSGDGAAVSGENAIELAATAPSRILIFDMS
jgi:redox-sensitive bicupin YhaK (pirin superfamily)